MYISSIPNIQQIFQPMNLCLRLEVLVYEDIIWTDVSHQVSTCSSDIHTRISLDLRNKKFLNRDSEIMCDNDFKFRGTYIAFNS